MTEQIENHELRVKLADVTADRDSRNSECDKLRQDLDTAARTLADASWEIAKLTNERDALREELAKWKICENCGEPLAGPGICDKAISDKEKGLEQMWEDTLTRAETAERELAEARAEIDRLDCTRREGGDMLHCRVDNLCRRCESKADGIEIGRAQERELAEKDAEIQRLTFAFSKLQASYDRVMKVTGGLPQPTLPPQPDPCSQGGMTDWRGANEDGRKEKK